MIHSERLPTLDTPRLRLRHIETRDLPALFRVFSNIDALRYWSHGPWTEMAQAERYLADIHRGLREQRWYQWGIARRDDDALIGTTTLFNLNPAHRRSELGYILHPENWGQGLAQEALSTLLDFAFRTLDLHRLEADTDPMNLPSNRLLERLGFQREGEMRERWLVDGVWADSLFWGLLRPQSRWA